MFTAPLTPPPELLQERGWRGCLNHSRASSWSTCLLLSSLNRCSCSAPVPFPSQSRALSGRGPALVVGNSLTSNPPSRVCRSSDFPDSDRFCSISAGHKILQFWIRPAIRWRRVCTFLQHPFWKQREFLSFQKPHREADVKLFATVCLTKPTLKSDS